MVKLIFKQNPVKSFKQFNKAMKQLTPKAYAQSKMMGHKWAVIGLMIGGTMMVLRGTWYFTIFIVAMCYLQGLEYRNQKQQLEAMIKLDQELAEGNDDGSIRKQSI